MNKFATLAVLICACLALGSCNSGGYGRQYGQQQRQVSSSGTQDNNGAAAASAAAAGGNDQRPVEIIAGGPRYGGSEQLRPILLDSGYNGHSHSEYGHGHGHVASGHYNRRPQVNNYGSSYGHQHQGYQQQGYARPRWSVQPAGATLLYPGQNHYRRYASPVEYSKVVLPVRAAGPVAKLYVPENNYGNHGGYQVEGPKY